MERYMLMVGALVACLLSAVIGHFLVPFLHRLKFGQTIKMTNGPKWHESKQGTPTMGGICFILSSTLSLGLIFTTLIFSRPQLFGTSQDMGLMLCLFSAFGFGLVGFVDDYIKVVKKQNLGLGVWQKIIAQVVITVVLLGGLTYNGSLTTAIALPGMGAIDLGWVFYPIAFLFIIFLVNAVNLTDGIDGLASSVTFVVMLGYILICGVLGYYHLSVYAACMAGALIGFLLYNFYPAKTFMGDTGSMFLGGMVTAMAFCLNRPELLIPLGCVYIWEAGCVVIQVSYFKFTKKFSKDHVGRRIFKMTPIHHSFELRGWPEVKIVGVFSAIAAIGVALAAVWVFLS